MCQGRSLPTSSSDAACAVLEIGQNCSCSLTAPKTLDGALVGFAGSGAPPGEASGAASAEAAAGFRPKSCAKLRLAGFDVGSACEGTGFAGVRTDDCGFAADVDASDA